jgi:hypothetical protein
MGAPSRISANPPAPFRSAIVWPVRCLGWTDEAARIFRVLGCAAVAWPLGARAQQSAKPVIGFLNSGSPGSYPHNVREFHQGLREAGFVENRKVAIEYRWAEDQTDRLPAMAADLLRSQVTVIFANGPAAASCEGSDSDDTDCRPTPSKWDLSAVSIAPAET